MPVTGSSLNSLVARLADSGLPLRTLNRQPPPPILSRRSGTAFSPSALLNDQFTFHIRVECAAVVVRAFLPCDVAPRCSRLDSAGIENRLLGLTIRSCGVGHDVLVLPFDSLARMNGQGCRLKLEFADDNRNHLWWDAF